MFMQETKISNNDSESHSTKIFKRKFLFMYKCYRSPTKLAIMITDTT